MARSCFSKLGRFIFAFNLACTTITAYIVTKLVEFTLGWCTSKNFREQICLMTCGMAWTFTILTSPWIRAATTEDSKKILSQLHSELKNTKPGNSGIMLVMNHASFFDTCM